MNRILNLLERIYGKLVEFFPPKFKAEFGEELQVVFSAMVSAAARQGRLAFAVACTKEFRDYPILLIRSHLEEKTMLKMFRSQPARFAFRGAIGISLGYICAKDLAFLFTIWFSQAIALIRATLHGPTNFFWDPWFHLIAVSGACAIAALAAGLLFALLFSDRAQFGWYTCIGIAGWFISIVPGYVLTMAFSWASSPWTQVTFPGKQLLPFTNMALVGGVLSMMLCIAESKKRSLLRPLAIASILVPIVSYLFPLFLLRVTGSTSSSLISTSILEALFLCGAILLAVKSDPKNLWVVVAGAFGFPIFFFLCRKFIILPTIQLAVGNGLDATSLAITAVNAISIALPEGIVFGLVIGLIFGWQRRSPLVTA